MKKYFILLFFFSLITQAYSISTTDWEINDDNFKFTLTLPDEWKKTDSKLTDDKDAISYSLERKDKRCSIMILAFKLTAVKNLEDFIYTLEKDATLNIPGKSGDYTKVILQRAGLDKHQIVFVEKMRFKKGDTTGAAYTRTTNSMETQLGCGLSELSVFNNMRDIIVKLIGDQ